MKYLFILLYILVLISKSAFAADCQNHDTSTKIAKITSNALLILDWAQTRHIAINPNYKEGGIAQTFIGEYPSKKDVNLFFAASLLFNNYFPCLFSEKKRRLYYIGVSVYQFKAVKHNIEIGIKFDF